MYIQNTLILLCIATAIHNAADQCGWCRDPVLTCTGITDSSGWTLARAIGPTYNSWFPYTDALQGNDAREDNDWNLYNIGSFSDNVAGYNQFLFVHGDCSAWLIASKEAVNGAFYANTKRQICSSSESANPTQANWYNRQNNPEDPWVFTVDHGTSGFESKCVYGENALTDTFTAGFQSGVYVYIRKVNNMDEYGCATTVDCSVLDIDGFLVVCSNEWTALTNEDSVIGSRIDGVDIRINGIDEEIEDIQEVLKKLEGAAGIHSPGIGDFVISTENKDLLILCMFILNLLVVIGGCIVCMLWMKSKNQYSKFEVYESNSENERQKLQN